MKGTITILSALFVLAFAACNKDEKATTATTALTASQKDTIKVGQPVSFNLPSVGVGSAVSWSVSPSTNTQVSANGPTASIVFGEKKTTYTVTATYGSTVGSIQVNTSDSVYQGTATGSTIGAFSTGDQLKLKATRIDSMGTASSGIMLQAQTANTYNCLNNSLAYTSTMGTNSYAFNFTGVSVPPTCSGGSTNAGGFLYLFPLATGSTALSIVFNGTTYTGTIVKTGTGFTIKWDYSSGVTISPTTL